MADERRLSKTGAELQDVVQLLDTLTGEIFIPASDLEPRNGSPVIAVPSGSDFIGYTLDAAAQEEVATSVSIPNDLPACDVNSIINISYIWSAAATSGDVLFVLKYRAMSVGEDAASAATQVTALDTVDSNADYLSETPMLSIVAGNIAPNDFLILSCGRIGTDGSDTMTGYALIHGVKISYTTNPRIVS